MVGEKVIEEGKEINTVNRSEAGNGKNRKEKGRKKIWKTWKGEEKRCGM